MKRLVLLAFLFVAAGSTAGCGPHPNDITDDVASATAPAARA